MFFYRLPVISSRLFFRVGAGLGVGWHHIVDYREWQALSQYGQKEKEIPYINFEAAWILRIAKGFEMKFQPLVIMVLSDFSFSPVKLGAPTTVQPWLSDVGFSLTFGWRY